MTRSKRVRAACERFAEGPPVHLPGETVDEGIEAALDAALKDVGGLDGLEVMGKALASGFATEKRLNAKLTADRDRLREALRRLTVEQRTEGYDTAREAGRAALRDSEAGT